MADIETLAATKRTHAEGAAPSAPSAGQVVFYAKTDGLMYSKDDAGTETLMSGGAGGGSVATDAIWDAAGDIVQGTGANTAARLALGAAGTVPRSTGSALAYALPPGYELDYVERTTDVNVTSTTEASGDLVLTSNAITFDGAPVICEVYTPRFAHPASDDVAVILSLFESTTQLGRLGVILADASTNVPFIGRYRFTPSAGSHTYNIKAHVGSGTGVIHSGSGGTGGEFPTYMRFTKV